MAFESGEKIWKLWDFFYMTIKGAKIQAKISISRGEKGICFWQLSLGQTCPTFHPTSIIFGVGWNVGHVWPKSEFKKEEKNVLDEAKMCWMKVWSRSNFSSNRFRFIQHIFCHFSCWIRLTTFFIQQYVKMMSFYCNRMSNWISKIRIFILFFVLFWIFIKKENKS